MKLDHIGVAVKDLDDARNLYGESFGFDLGKIEELPDRQLKICFVDVGGARVELLFPTHPDSAVGQFIRKKGPGVHHLCYEVENLVATLDELKNAGIRLIDKEPRPGAHGMLVAFVHPSSAFGVLTEFAQKV
jgi:methylmalonyl-CoA epimerase